MPEALADLHITSNTHLGLLSGELTRIRNRYLALFRQKIQHVQATGQPLHIERLSCIRRARLLNDQYRVDIAWGNPHCPSVLEVLQAPQTISVSTLTELESEDVLLAPLSWNSISIEASCSSLEPADILPWFDRWMESDIIAENNLEPAGRIHSVRIDNPAQITVDFGSAPVDALLGLLEILQSDDDSPLRVFTQRIDNTATPPQELFGYYQP